MARASLERWQDPRPTLPSRRSWRRRLPRNAPRTPNGLKRRGKVAVAPVFVIASLSEENATDDDPAMEPPAASEPPGAVPAAPPDAHAQALRLPARASARVVRRRVPGRARDDVPRHGCGEGAAGARAARDGHLAPGLRRRLRCRGRRAHGGGPALADGARLPRRDGAGVLAGGAARL